MSLSEQDDFNNPTVKDFIKWILAWLSVLGVTLLIFWWIATK